MDEFTRLLAFGAATFCLGGSAVITILVALIRRGGGDGGEGCLGTILIATFLAFSAYLFSVAVFGG